MILKLLMLGFKITKQYLDSLLKLEVTYHKHTDNKLQDLTFKKMKRLSEIQFLLITWLIDKDLLSLKTMYEQY